MEKLTVIEYILKELEIHSEQYEQEGDLCIAEYLYDEISDGDNDILIRLVEGYANYCLNHMEGLR